MKKITFAIISAIFVSVLFCACGEDETPPSPYTEYLPDSNPLLKGKWGQVNDIDSLILIISSDNIIKYVYERRTTKLIDRIDYGKYRLRKKAYTNDNTTLSYILLDNFAPNYDDNYLFYTVSEKTLLILSFGTKSYTRVIE